MEANAYSRLWFETFLRTQSPEWTAREVDFVARQAPRPDYRTLLDVCCGEGRHTIPLAERGYDVTGLDRDQVALSAAQERAAGLSVAARFVEGDMRDLAASVTGPFDACVCLWQSFGYFDAATNEDILRQMSELLHPGGRLMLDIYHPGYFMAHQGERTVERNGRAITISERLNGNHLSVDIDYGSDVAPDRMEWELYTPEAIQTLAARHGLRTVLACTLCDETQPPAPDLSRMQFVFERTPG
ncbi:MAG TPA: class I SAM-dependent methyltransferase [Ktedonobacterales bacterium]|jgi:D-alanine-D-alanine ligase